MKLLTIEKIADKLQCSVPTIYRYVSKKTIPHIKQGHRLLFVEEDIEAWLESKKVQITHPARNSLEDFVRK